MAQRVEPADSLDDFPTQPWGTRALIQKLREYHYRLEGMSVWEPACNRGYMARPLAETFPTVHATDVFDYSAEWSGQQAVQDFLLSWGDDAHQVDFVITNPPFKLAEEFYFHALRFAQVGVALLLRTQWLHGVGRHSAIFTQRPYVMMPFAERLPLVRGRVDPNASTATDYSWFFFPMNGALSGINHIAPCRKQLERADDYPDLPVKESASTPMIDMMMEGRE